MLGQPALCLRLHTPLSRATQGHSGPGLGDHVSGLSGGADRTTVWLTTVDVADLPSLPFLGAVSGRLQVFLASYFGHVLSLLS
jgi:hypothetical protein